MKMRLKIEALMIIFLGSMLREHRNPVKMLRIIEHWLLVNKICFTVGHIYSDEAY
jgi:hypothetical protein